MIANAKWYNFLQDFSFCILFSNLDVGGQCTTKKSMSCFKHRSSDMETKAVGVYKIGVWLRSRDTA